MKTTAAILVETGKPLEIHEIQIPELKTGQVLVEIAYSGVCHTQVLEARGYRGSDPYVPHCLGHEGSGVVLKTGPGVTAVNPGDKVILSWLKGTGHNVPGSVYDWEGQPVNAGAITTFQHHAVISENRVSPLPDAIPMEHAPLLGCALPTGLGVVFNTAKAGPGQSMAIFGLGGIGLCAVAGAALAGCVPIIAVDINPSKLVIAKKIGATHCIDATETDPINEIQNIVPGGVDYAIECSGQPSVMLQALNAVRAQGGAAVIVGNAQHGQSISLDPHILNQGKSLLGTWGGDSVPQRDFSKYCRLMSSGRLDVTPFISKKYPLEQINDALNDLEAGRVVRPLISMKS